MAEYENLSLEVRDYVAASELHHSLISAIRTRMYTDIASASREVASNTDTIRVTILTGTGRCMR